MSKARIIKYRVFRLRFKGSEWVQLLKVAEKDVMVRDWLYLALAQNGIDTTDRFTKQVASVLIDYGALTERRAKEAFAKQTASKTKKASRTLQ